MLSAGFFTTLFKQFLALLSAFFAGVAPGGGASPYIAAADLAPPTVQVRQQPLATRVLQTQLNAFANIGLVVTETADGGLNLILGVPNTLAEALNRGGLAGLPAGIAEIGQEAVDVLVGGRSKSGGVGASGLVDAITNTILAELDLLPGADRVVTNEIAAPADLADGSDVGALLQLQRQPLIVRIVTTQVDAVTDIGTAATDATTELTTAILAAPSTITDAIAEGGPAALPAGLQLATRRIVLAIGDGADDVIQTVGDALRAELRLIPGGVVANPNTAFAAEPEPQPTGGVLETAVRVPLAFGVAGADLARAGLTATTDITGGYATAARDIVVGAQNQLTRRTSTGNNQLKATISEEPQTLAEGLARAPVTIRAGYVAAGQDLQAGAGRARTDFRNTLNPRAETRLAGSESKVSLGLGRKKNTVGAAAAK